MNFYMEDKIDEFVDVCEIAGLSKEETKKALNFPCSSTPKTWKTNHIRNHADVVANWIHKELNRSGTQGVDSNRRLELYQTRRNMINLKDTKTLYQNAPKVCKATGHPINYGLGITKVILDQYFMNVYGTNGISPSLERVDSNQDYNINNVIIISSGENILNNLKVNTTRLREVQNLFSTIVNTVPTHVQVLRLLQVGECKAEFEKLDGSTRIMRATLNLDAVPSEHHPKAINLQQHKHNINVWDLDLQSWRSFSYHRLKKFSV